MITNQDKGIQKLATFVALDNKEDDAYWENKAIMWTRPKVLRARQM